MNRRSIAAVVAALAVAIAVGYAVSSALARTPVQTQQQNRLGATVLIGTGGLTWTDVNQETTPNLWTLLRDGSSGALTVRSVEPNTCPVDGWLSLSAGSRAAAPRSGLGSAQTRPCPAIPAPVDGAIPQWQSYLQAAANADFGAQPGLLTRQLDAADRCVQAVGPGAAIGAATREGRVARYRPYAAQTLLVDLNSCPVTLVDVGSVRDPDDLPAGEQAPTGTRAEQIAAVDARIGEVIAAAPSGADFLVASLSDAGRTERLRMAVARGPHFGPGRLDSASTRQPGLVQAADLTVSVLELSDAEVPASLGGAPLTSDAALDNSQSRAGDRLQKLVDYDLASHEVDKLVPPFFSAFAYGQLVIYLLVFLVWKGRIGTDDTRLQTLGIVRVVAVCAASVPASAFLANLIPWWRFSIPGLSIVGAVGLFVAIIGLSSLRWRWSASRALGPMIVISAVTMVVLAVDVITGSRLQQSSLLGLQPVVAGRFYGMGNVTFALFATSAILLATAISSHLLGRGPREVSPGATRGELRGVRALGGRVLAGVVAGMIGLVAVVVDGAPFWGADGGGPPALLPGVAFLVLSILGVAITWKRALLIGAACVSLFFVIAFLDWLGEPSSRSHLGRFIQAIIDGGAIDIIVRKAEQNLSILINNRPLTLLVPSALLFFAYVLARPTSWGSRGLARSFERAPTLRSGLIALLITLGIGFLINDSGTAIPAVGATLAIPLIISTIVKNLELDLLAAAPTATTQRSRQRRSRRAISPTAATE